MSVSKVRGLTSDCLPRKPVFDPRAIHMGPVIDEAADRQVSLILQTTYFKVYPLNYNSTSAQNRLTRHPGIIYIYIYIEGLYIYIYIWRDYTYIYIYIYIYIYMGTAVAQ